MLLAPGSRIGGLEILGVIGQGGMGVVYRGRDLKLRREVAIKALSPEFAADTARLVRFQREAQAIAALNHPNVVTIYSVEEIDEVHVIVMELVDGAPLVDLLSPDGLPIDRILAYALPISDAIAAAHQQSIVHRDLKPANVMVRSDGRVKVLDFGLAKIVAAESGRAERTTELVTAKTTVLGTAGYMSPEQAEGRQVDSRTDIFSFGVMLYEMATGTRPFTGSSSLAVLSSILKDDPKPLSELKPGLPPDYERIVRRCLAKDPARRFQTALDVRNELEDLRQQLSGGRELPRSTRPRLPLAAVVSVAVAILLVIGAATWRFASKGAGPAPAPAGFRQLTSRPGAEMFGRMSADGEWVLYTGEGNGNRDIFLQRVGGQAPINLTADSPADDEQGAFSPDGERIVFRSSRDGGGLFVMGRTGEGVKRITREGFNPDWSPDGTQIAYTLARTEFRPQNAEQRGPVIVASVNDGARARELHENAMLPRWSPDGARIAFSARAQNDAQGTSNIVTVAADGEGMVSVTHDSFLNWNPVWSPDGAALFYVSNRGGSPNIWRVAVDRRTGHPSGEPQALITPASNIAYVSISADGRRLSYSAVTETQNVEMLRFDPVKGEILGQPQSVTTGSRFWANPDPSPDGTQVTFYSQVSPEGDLYVAAADGSTQPRQLTDDIALDRVPRWSPDGQWIAMFSDRSNELQVWKIRVDGSDLRQVTKRPSGIAAWSPDGRRMAVARVGPKGGGQAASIIDGDRGDALAEEIALPAGMTFTPNSWSPDGTRLAGTPNYSTEGILLYSLSDHRLEQVSKYGEWPVWLPDSRRIVFVSRGRQYHILDTRTRAASMIWSSLRDTLGPPRLSRDGQKLFFQRRTTESDIWVATLR